MSVRGLVVGVLLCVCQACGSFAPRYTDGADGRRFYFETLVSADAFTVSDAVAVERDQVSDGELAASCRVLIDWKTDHALGLDLIVSENAGLLRSAELLSGEFAGSEVALDAETRLVQGDTPEAIVDALETSGGREASEEARRYLDAREVEPSPLAAEQFVVYITPRGMSELLVVRMSIEPIPHTADPWGNETIDVGRDYGPSIKVDPAWCES